MFDYNIFDTAIFDTPVKKIYSEIIVFNDILIKDTSKYIQENITISDILDKLQSKILSELIVLTDLLKYPTMPISVTRTYSILKAYLTLLGYGD
jgi:uncharacterized protein YydD (DUF2326 family)